MIWGTGHDQDLLKFYKDLIVLRKDHPVLRRGDRMTLFSDEKILAYRRKDSQESFVTVLNISDTEVLIELEMTETTVAFATGPDVQLATGKKEIVLPPFGGMVLR